jgi:hypothetical protein
VPLRPNALVGVDFAAACDQVARDLEATHEEARWRNDGGEGDRDYTRVPALVWFDIQTGFWVSRPKLPQPFVGMFAARGRSRAHAMSELRIVHAWQWHAITGMDWDAARSHAARYAYDFDEG